MNFDFSDPNFVATVATSVASIAAAIVSIIKAVQASKKAAKLALLLEDAKARETYIVCPNCKKRIPLSEASFHLPNGAVDNNLNGVPDVEED